MTKKIHEAAARVVLERGIRFDLANGFAITLHDSHPDAPRPPHHLEMRLAGIGAGQFTNEDMSLLAQSLIETSRANKLFGDPRILVGIPNGASALAEAIYNNLDPTERCSVTLMTMEKWVTKKGRSFSVDPQHVPHDYHQRRVILVDDLVTSCASKLAAIQALQKKGLVVTDLLVFVDQSVDAQSILQEHNVKLHATWSGTTLTHWGEACGVLSPENGGAVRQFYADMTAFVETAM